MAFESIEGIATTVVVLGGAVLGLIGMMIAIRLGPIRARLMRLEIKVFGQDKDT